MKKITTLLFVVLGITVGFSQEDDRPENTGENFSLEGALALFKKSNSLEEFEKLINQEDNNVNNLDLNNDGKTDYVTVTDIKEGDTHVLVLSTYLSEKEKQDIATIGIEKTGNEQATLQIEGDTDLYAENTFAEPLETTENVSGGKGGPSVSEIAIMPVIVNVWFWPSVRFLYAPSYVVWVSPYRWAYYPRWWRPWRPFAYRTFYTRCAPHRVYYHRVPARRVVVAHRVYTPRRNQSTLVVHNRRGSTTVIRNNGRKTTTKVRRSPRNTTTVRTNSNRGTKTVRANRNQRSTSGRR